MTLVTLVTRHRTYKKAEEDHLILTRRQMQEERPRGRTNQKLRERVFALYGSICWLCGYDGADTIDHLVMISQGGSNDLENLRPAHGRKTEFCVGNFSRKRGKQTSKNGKEKVQVKPKGEEIPDPNKLIFTYGEGWIRKQFRGTSSTLFYGVAGLDLEDKFVQEWISQP